MMNRLAVPALVGALLGGCAAEPAAPSARSQDSTAALAPTPPRPLTIGESFTINSRILAEPRPINVFKPTIYGEDIAAPLPVLYMLDGGLNEDFLHVAGLVQVLVSNGGMRPVLLVGIPNTERRRDMTGPTTSADDRSIAPVVGASAFFRRFITEELIPTVRARYRTTDQSAIIGESLAGLFVVETYFLQPGLFNTYIAIDPSLWWNTGELVNAAESRIASLPAPPPTLFLASSTEPGLADVTGRLAEHFKNHPANSAVHYTPLTTETHATIYHPAALIAFRTVLPPVPEQQK